MSDDRHRLLRIALAGAGDIQEWRLGDPALAVAKGYPREFAAPLLDDYGIVFVDVTLDARDGRPVCHEVNGSNAVGSDALTGDSRLRAEGEASQALRRALYLGLLPDGRLARPAVTLHAHQHWKAFRTGGEFFPRVAEFAEILGERLPGQRVCLRGAGEPLGDEDLAVVLGEVPAVAAGIEIDAADGRLHYAGRPVVFAGNPNLLPELIRTRKLRDAGGIDVRPFPGWRLAWLIHDKARQQDLLSGTGIKPLRHFEAHSVEQALDGVRKLLVHGPVVLKPNGASGGAGVHVVVAEMSEAELRERIDAVVSDCVRKYGENAEASAFPIRGFEFVRSTGYPMDDGERLWDLRVAVQFEPGRAWAYPVSMRLAPAPFDPLRFHGDRDQWISNVSGRQVTLLKSGMDDEALLAVGLTPEKLEETLQASVRWTQKAWDAAAREGVRAADVFEDASEREDPGFYPRARFAT